MATKKTERLNEYSTLTTIGDRQILEVTGPDGRVLQTEVPPAHEIKRQWTSALMAQCMLVYRRLREERGIPSRKDAAGEERIDRQLFGEAMDIAKAEGRLDFNKLMDQAVMFDDPHGFGYGRKQ